MVAEWASELGLSEIPVCRLERPAEEAHGDYATPLCMQMAKLRVAHRGHWLRSFVRCSLADPEPLG